MQSIRPSRFSSEPGGPGSGGGSPCVRADLLLGRAAEGWLRGRGEAEEPVEAGREGGRGGGTPSAARLGGSPSPGPNPGPSPGGRPARKALGGYVGSMTPAPGSDEANAELTGDISDEASEVANAELTGGISEDAKAELTGGPSGDANAELTGGPSDDGSGEANAELTGGIRAEGMGGGMSTEPTIGGARPAATAMAEPRVVLALSAVMPSGDEGRRLP